MINPLYVVFFLSMIIYVVAAIVTIIFVIPLQIKETGVKNGLYKLRTQLLTRGIFGFVIILISIFLNTVFIFDVHFLHPAVTLLIFIHALSTLVKTSIDFKIYHQQYTPKNRKLHEEIELLEKAGETQ